MDESFLRVGDLITVEIDFTEDICLVLVVDRVEDIVVVFNSRLDKKETFQCQWIEGGLGATVQSRCQAE